MCYYNGTRVSREDYIRLKQLEKAASSINLYRPMQSGFDYSDFPVNGEESPENDYAKVQNQKKIANEFIGSSYYNYMIFYFWEISTRKLVRRKHIWATIEELANKLIEVYKSGDIIIGGIEVEAILQKHFKKPPRECISVL